MILLVDDKQENLFSLKELLLFNKYEVDTAASGEEALSKVLKNDYALIILDVQMPGMDGYEVAENLNGYSKTRDIPVIFLSAVNLDKNFITRGYHSGGVDYITKPFDPDLLLLKVSTFYRLYRQKQDLQVIQKVLEQEILQRKNAQSEVEQLNQKLEEKVASRTQQLLRLNEELEASNTELAQYASLASHDLQEPLRKIMTFSQLLEEQFMSDSPDARYYLQKIFASSARMRNLINDLLNYSRLAVEAYLSPVDLNEVLSDTLSDLEVPIREKKVLIQTGPMPTVEAIPGHMQQLFLNLISNSIKFSRPDQPPRIEISSTCIAEKSLEVPPDPTGSFVRLAFRDNGIGFEEKYNDKIFTIFQRLHGQKQYAGTGIGLAIVKKIVDKHNGLIAVTSRVGEGTTFSIVLPKVLSGEKTPVQQPTTPLT
jgi:signal transduction histidine kinase